MTSRLIRSLCLLVAFLLLERSGVLSQNHSAPVSAIRTLYPNEFGIAHPAGLSYSIDHGQFFVLEKHNRDRSVVASSTVVILSPYEDLVGRVDLDFLVGDTLNTVFDDRGKRLLFLHDELAELVQISAGDNGILDPRTRARFDVSRFGLSGAQGMAVDPDRRVLLILDSVARHVVRVDLNTARFDGAVSRLNLAPLGMTDARGIAVNPADGHLYVMSPAQQRLYELTQGGEPVATYDLTDLNLTDPRGLVIAPSADLTDSRAVMHLYIADSGLPDSRPAWSGIAPGALGEQQPGKIVEVALGAEAPRAAAGTAPTPLTLVQTIDMSEFSPPSPDPAGVAFISTTGRLLVSDSEVNEMPIFQGANLFEVNLSGTMHRTGVTTAYSDEPTGIGFNPANGHIFISDDTESRSVYEVTPGADGLYGTGDDILVATISTQTFNSGDPEGVTFDTTSGDLFIADGVNNEVYRVNPGPNGVFDGAPAGGGDDVVTSFDTQSLGIIDPEGIHHDVVSGNLILTGKITTELYEVTTSGSLVRTFDISAANAKKPAGVAMAPGSANPAAMNFYVVARGVDNGADPNENDGKIYELTLGFDPPTTTPTHTPTSTPTPTNTPTSTPTPTNTPTSTPTPTNTPTSTPTPTHTSTSTPTRVVAAMEPCDADYDTNGSIDVADVVLQAQVWHSREDAADSGYDPMFDPIRDGVIRVQDLLWVGQYVGLDCSGP